MSRLRPISVVVLSLAALGVLAVAVSESIAGPVVIERAHRGAFSTLATEESVALRRDIRAQADRVVFFLLLSDGLLGALIVALVLRPRRRRRPLDVTPSLAPTPGAEFSIVIASPSEYERLIAEIRFGDHILGWVAEEDGPGLFTLDLLPTTDFPRHTTLRLPLERFIARLTDAKRELAQR